MPNHPPQPTRRQSLSALLQASLRPAHKLVVVGIGSDLRGDDVAGLLVLHELERSLAGSGPKNIHLINGGTAPENLTGEIVRLQPSHILLVDAACMGLKTGAAALLDIKTVAGMSCSSHVLPLNILADYLKQSLPCEVIILGIQPSTTEFGLSHSKAIDRTAQRVARLILDAAPLDTVKST